MDLWELEKIQTERLQKLMGYVLKNSPFYRDKLKSIGAEDIKTIGNISQLPFTKISGRSDDMLIVKGINVFPSQVEHVLLSIHGTTPNYQIVVDRNSSYQDSIEIIVEIDEKMFSDQLSDLTSLEKKIIADMTAVLSITPIIKLVSPNSIQRSEGKAVRVIDKRKI
ncbi:MAG: hypothetical protein LBB09_01035 [Rickettsiales bacterium]|jgi:phenylacetate-CoA ligase|nr:hypothetical protein [Rickettsiales bacterium]